MLFWNIFEVTHSTKKLTERKFRGTLRAYANKQDITLLVENATDKENCVRFALHVEMSEKNSSESRRIYLEKLNTIEAYIEKLASGADVRQILSKIPNPILSKLSVNDDLRYVTE